MATFWPSFLTHFYVSQKSGTRLCGSKLKNVSKKTFFGKNLYVFLKKVWKMQKSEKRTHEKSEKIGFLVIFDPSFKGFLGSLKIEKMTKNGQKSDFFCIFSCLFSENLFFEKNFCAGQKVGWQTSFSTSKQSLFHHFWLKHTKMRIKFSTFWGGGRKYAKIWGQKRADFSALNFQRGPALRCSWQKSIFSMSKNVTHFLGQNDHFWPFFRKKV